MLLEKLVIPAILELYVLSLGVAFLLGSINVKYRDITSIWEVFIQALFYAVPIIYPISMVATTSELAAKIILLDPIAQAIQLIRYGLITTDTVTTLSYTGNVTLTLIPIAITASIFITGAVVFRRKSKFFAEEV